MVCWGEADVDGVNFGEQPDLVDYALIYQVRRPILEKAVRRFLSNDRNKALLAAFEKANSTWLNDYAEFMAIKYTLSLHDALPI